MSDRVVVVSPREETGKNASRRLRRQGMVPAVVYGMGRKTVPIVVDRKVLTALVKESGGGNAVFLLELAGTKKRRHTMIRDLTVDPITRQVIHVDFQRVDMAETVRVDVPIELVGVPEGVRNEAGLLDFVTREIGIECLPGRIPPYLECDVTELHIGENVKAEELGLPPDVTLVDDPDRVIASVVGRGAAEVEEEEAEEELLEAEVPEPELVGKGAKEESATEEEPSGA